MNAEKLYSELAAWWPLMSPAEEYAEEADFYARTLASAATGPLEAVLELGAGGGNNASHMKQRFALTLVDSAPAMLTQSRALNPECEHVEGDMRTVRLGRTFDAVFVHDAICYMTTPAQLRQAVETAFVHCRPGGAALFAPDYVRESFRESTDHGGSDGNGVALRYLEWTYDPDPDDTTYTADYVYLLRDADGETRVEHDRHEEGLFPRELWLHVLTEAGFEAHSATFRHSDVDYELEVFVGRRPDQHAGA